MYRYKNVAVFNSFGKHFLVEEGFKQVVNSAKSAFNRWNKHVFLLQGGYVFTCGHLLDCQQDFTKTTKTNFHKTWMEDGCQPRIDPH